MKKLTFSAAATLPRGFQATGLAAGLKQNGAPDMALFYSEPPATLAGVFTTNQVKAATVRLDAERNTGDSTRALEEAIQKLPQIVSCHYISGSGTFELQVICQDLDSFSRFARESLINLPHVKDLHTSFSLGEVKASSTLPLNHLKLK